MKFKSIPFRPSIASSNRNDSSSINKWSTDTVLNQFKNPPAKFTTSVWEYFPLQPDRPAVSKAYC